MKDRALWRNRSRRRAHKGGITVVYLLVLLLTGFAWFYHIIPDIIYVEQGAPIAFSQYPFLSAQRKLNGSHAASTAELGSYNVVLSVGGILPVKQVRTIITQRPVVTVCGTPFGIKMFSDGALVVGFSDLYTDYGRANPAKEAGLKLGDLVISIGGMPTRSNDELKAAIEQAEGKSIAVVYVREEVQYTTSLTPVRDGDGNWKAGMWVRDSSAGVGTLTFVDADTGVFAGLGHSINDSDTGKSVTLRSGEIVACQIIGYTAGSVGDPGELKGRFTGSIAIGTIIVNEKNGVYGTVRRSFSGRQCEAAFSQEITTGPASILTTIEGEWPQEYSVEIEKITLAGENANRNMVIHVTDERLLETTGGIVQGMSGSPILQNGRLVGAVTHVLVNDPTRGYGIAIDSMLETAQTVSDRNLKEAS